MHFFICTPICTRNFILAKSGCYKEVPLGEEVLVGRFFLFEHPIIILFDSGALHDFLSLTCTQKAGVTLCAIQVPYSISTLRG
jgi:hypothetical protein